MEYIGAFAFSSCEGLEQVVLPADLRAIGTRAFVNCNKLTDINIPDGCELSAESLGFCDGLTSVRIPDQCYVQYDAFNGSDNLKVTYRGAGYTKSTMKKLYELCAELRQDGKL